MRTENRAHVLVLAVAIFAAVVSSSVTPPSAPSLAASSDVLILVPLDSFTPEALDLGVEIAGVPFVDLPSLLPAGVNSFLPQPSVAGRLHSFPETPPPRFGS
ncbi:MAG: hypothetical protein ABIT01_05215 [Thermoanaerobaculia bacterium]